MAHWWVFFSWSVLYCLHSCSEVNAVLQKWHLKEVFCMNSFMSRTRWLTRKWFLTKLTLVWFLPSMRKRSERGLFCMNSFMSLTWRLTCKWFLTKVTLVWFLSSVRPFVLFTVLPHYKWLFTKLTLVGFITCMNPFVYHTCRLTSETFPTDLTFEKFFPCMNSFVFNTRSFIDKGLITILTLVSILQNVYFFMPSATWSAAKWLCT